ncbi:hypothetical protein R3P38DRAFT_3132840 [Favolaschia claudopus]|uniref:F-box domain-containing protein n=1 Tax=Favolaschia claudopus TaxID=2862362 RepID=A0AAV9Z856_9AGAR
MAAEPDEVLRNRLAGVQFKIDNRIEILRNLARIKSGIQRQLNDRHDPIARLPLEISSAIFTHCVASRDEYGTLSAAILPLRICTLWTEIALFTPSLWANLHVNIPDEVTEEWVAFLAGWLARGNDYPLLLSLGGTSASKIEIKRIIVAHAHRLRELEVQPHPYLTVFLPDEDGTVFPILEALFVHPTGNDWRHPMDANTIVQTLKSAPLLKTLSICTKSISNHLAFQVQAHARHTALTTLRIEEMGDAGSVLLPFLTLPSLVELEIIVEDRETIDRISGVISFLTRSSPPLKALYLNACQSAWQQDVLERLLDVVPGLETFSLWNAYEVRDAFLDLLRILDSAGRHRYLPELTELLLTVYASWPEPEWYTKLAGLLSARAENMKYVSLDFYEWEEDTPYFEPALPADEDKRIFKELIGKGMEIDLGPVTNCLEESSPQTPAVQPS